MPTANHSYSDLTQKILAEISRQPQALKDLTAFYCQGVGRSLFDEMPETKPPLFIGEGVSYQAACMAEKLCLHGGVAAHAVEAGEFLTWSPKASQVYSPFFLFNPEIELTIKNSPNHSFAVRFTLSPLTSKLNKSEIELPLCVADGTSNSAGVFTNSLVLGWLLSRYVIGSMDGSETESLKHLRQQMQVMLEGKEAFFERWQTLLAGTSHWVLVGDEFNEPIVKYTSELLASWARVPVLAVSQADFKESYLGLSEAGMSVICFQNSIQEDQEKYLVQAANQGANVIRVVGGFPQRFNDQTHRVIHVEQELLPITGAISGQLLAVCMAEKFLSSFKQII